MESLNTLYFKNNAYSLKSSLPSAFQPTTAGLYQVLDYAVRVSYPESNRIAVLHQSGQLSRLSCFFSGNFRRLTLYLLGLFRLWSHTGGYQIPPLFHQANRVSFVALYLALSYEY